MKSFSKQEPSCRHTPHLLEHARPLLANVSLERQCSDLDIGPVEAGGALEEVGVEADAVGDLYGGCCAVLVAEL